MPDRCPYLPVHEERLDRFIPDEQVQNLLLAGEIRVATATRPIPGQWEWRGGGGAGYFYAAQPVDEADTEIPETHDWIFRQWRDLGADELRVFDEQEIWNALLNHLEEEGIDVDETLEFMDRPEDWADSASFLCLPAPLRMPECCAP